ncbi:ribonuclease R [Buchnera aphidicola]|jgi:ribonuclease R|uniref:Ribonuclease R n=1 Tax=Buchnera aphidicola subsp. Schizaphis graminum (strain Sg) TaxID=198804 RepID=RNR_BUCAP|nr:ribonuclease R [Buchnera aphidicola]Q8K917.1 RecName: Full=Ribonuclease R; Short=RNase R; AltName: Full=VacB protein homolog [Buchnera aphidicola str. Sg (Schizaphis graminum)]AAM68084.1 ribonuclease R [Buchnera aphidicola str. Sg (Schizaphis graminum)]AWI49426.1 ribonuclease R [Buchnera aphidicola (Schizaphis graminum)]
MVVDSYQKKETKKYRNFIPRREQILFLLKTDKDLISQKKLEKKFSINSQEQKKALRRRLRAMERDGQIIYTRNRCYITPENLKIVTGKVIGHRDGYGFLRTETFKDDLWLSIEQMKLCIHGDVILAHIVKSDRKGRNSAKVLKILRPNDVLIVGRYCVDNKKKFVIPNDTRFNFKIFILDSLISNENISIGTIVVVKLRENATKKSKIQGTIVEVLGKEMGTNLAIKIALRTHCIPYLWSKEVEYQLCGIKSKINEKDFKNRIDLRHLPFFTIDEEDARDFDDAIFCKKKTNGEKGWKLWVAISDVSYYIQPDTALDKAASKRGTSIYFPSLVIPMLPEKISIDVCSLNPNAERLSLICEMNLSNKGELITYKHYEAVICSHGRFTYNEIFKIWNGDIELCFKYKKLLKYIQNLSSLQKILKKYNVSKRGIYFENIEAKFILDSNYRIKNISQNIRNDAHKFIESCMILANIASAEFVKKHKSPVLFRNHDRPDKDSIINFRSVLKKLGLSLLGGEIPESTDYSELLKKISTRPDYEMIQTILLRSMKQAVYSPDNRGHFGLSLSSYVHFTSPIRRYPDLLVHRVIKNLLLKEKNLSKYHLYNLNEVTKIGLHCSMTERRADEATRDVLDWLKCDFMQKKIGDVLTGVISNVTSFGFFVRLNQFFIDGLVHIATLIDDYYYFDSIGLKLIGKSSKNTYCLGDTLKVKVISVNLNERKIELSLYMSR